MMTDFDRHRGYSTMFGQDRLTVGLFFPIESYDGAIPVMDLEEQIRLARLAEKHEFSGLFFRDVLLHDPSFGDVGQIHDPWVYAGYVAAHTSEIALATGSIIASLRHPLHLAKAAASLDRLSEQRLVLGLATGDRPVEFPAFVTSSDERGALFRETMAVSRNVWRESFSTISTPRVALSGEGDVLPKPALGDIPILVTGSSRQSPQWIAEHGDGWLYYPQATDRQRRVVRAWRELTQPFKPFAQSLYVDLSEDPAKSPQPIQLGLSAGREALVDHLSALRDAGVNHVGLNLKYGRRPADEVVQELGEYVLPHFPAL